MKLITEADGHHSLQPALQSKHRETAAWLSSVKLWRKELSFFQDMLDGTAPYFTSPADKKKVSRFQNLFLYYQAEVLPNLRTKLRNHERLLGDMFTRENISDGPYYAEHESLLQEWQQAAEQFRDLKRDFFQFIEQLK